MMVPSNLPNFEIPTGLMGFRGGMRGFGKLGQVNLGPLASLSVSPSYVPTFYTQWPGANPSNFTQDCLDDATSAAIAAAVGGQVVKGPAENIQATNGPIPLCNYIQMPNGQTIQAAAVAQTLLDGDGRQVSGATSGWCGKQMQLYDTVPDSAIDSSCGVSANPNITAPTPVYVTGPAPTPVVTTPPATQLSNPTGTSVSFTSSDTCTSIGPKIAALQTVGVSNPVIWSQIPASLIACANVKALNPQASVYQSSAPPVSQPGGVETLDPNTTGMPILPPGTCSANQTYIPPGGTMPNNGLVTPTGACVDNAAAGTTDNTTLYIGIAVAAAVALFAFERH